MNCSHLLFSGHAVRRMFQRGIKRQEITEIVAIGEIIASYPDDQPHPSFLVLGFSGETPVHVVVAQSQQDHDCVVVTTYIPDSKLWDDGFRMRKT